MKNIKTFALASILFLSCNSRKDIELSNGIWLGRLDVMDHETLPFNFRVTSIGESHGLEIYNADEVIEVDEIEIKQDSIKIKLPVFEGYLLGKFSETEIKGSFIKESVGRTVPFTATFGENERFKTFRPPSKNISGVWETTFSPNTDESYMAKGIFEQHGSRLTGTYRTVTGDYRFLDGAIDGDSMKLSTFDGAHAFLFKAHVTDSSMSGTFYSGNHFKEPFEARRNADYELPDGDSLTYLKQGFDKLSFSFPDEKQHRVSMDDKQFKDKVVIVQIMGTWCPNCLDETMFLVNYLKKQKNQDLKVVGLAFETSKTEEKAFKAINRLKERLGVPYPILLAQYGTTDKSEAHGKLPMLNHILSYPTTIFIDKKGVVRKIHTGFNGPATGDAYVAFKREFGGYVDLLLAE